MLESVHRRALLSVSGFWVLALLCVSQEALCQNRSGSITVSATNAPYIRASTVSQPKQLTITESDIERGFVDVPNAGLLALQTNNPDGTMLLLALEVGPVSSAEVSTNGLRRTIGAAGGWLDIPYTGTAKQNLQFSTRLFLRKEMEAGDFPWPLAFEARMRGAGSQRTTIACTNCTMTRPSSRREK